MTEPSPRQVLYAIVGGGFLLMTVILVTGAWMAGLAPVWWTIVMTLWLLLAGLWSGLNWRRTGAVLVISIGTLIVWAVGTLTIS